MNKSLQHLKIQFYIKVDATYEPRKKNPINFKISITVTKYSNHLTKIRNIATLALIGEKKNICISTY